MVEHVTVRLKLHKDMIMISIYWYKLMRKLN